MERFQPDGKYRSRHAPPRWEWLYGISYITRYIVHDVLQYDWLFIKKNQLDSERRQAMAQIRSLIPAFAELARERGFRFVVVFHPTGGEAASGTYSYGFDSLIADLRQTESKVDVIDVLAYWRAHQIRVGRKLQQFYWPTDWHHTRAGYALMGQAIANGLLALQLKLD